MTAATWLISLTLMAGVLICMVIYLAARRRRPADKHRVSQKAERTSFVSSVEIPSDPCPRCGAQVGLTKSECPHCHWSYTERAGGSAPQDRPTDIFRDEYDDQ